MTEGISTGISRAGSSVRRLPTTPTGIATLGLVAVTGGWMLSRMLPEGRIDDELSRVVPPADPRMIADKASQTAGEIADHLKEPVREAAVSVKDDVAAAVTGEH